MKANRITRVNEIIRRELATQLYRIIHRPDFVGLSENPEDKEKTQIIIAKHRNGETCEIDMLFKSEQIRFVELNDTLDMRAESMVIDSAMNSMVNHDFL